MVACVGRNSEGCIFHAETKSFPAGSPLLGEAYAALFSLKVADRLQIADVILEGDFQVVINALSGVEDDCPWSISSVISDPRQFSFLFRSCFFRFSPRDANYLAHQLACWAASSSFEGCVPHSHELLCNFPWVYAGFDPP